MKAVARFITIQLMNLLDWIYENRPADAVMTQQDWENRAEIRRIRSEAEGERG